MLKVLSINEEFNSLNWFDSIDIKLTGELAKLKKKQEKAAAIRKERVRNDIYRDEDDEVEEQQSVR